MRVHGGTDMAPQVRWEAGGFLPQLPETLEQLDLLLLTVAKARRVHPDGIRFQGLRYIDLTLAAYVGEDVIVRYDPRDLAEIRVYHHGKFLCRAVSQELSGQTVSIKEIERARNQRRKQLREGITQRATLVDSLLAVHKRHRFIGLCYGPPGVGKSQSARHYSQWDMIEAHDLLDREATTLPPALQNCRTVFYTPSVANTPRSIDREVHVQRVKLAHVVRQSQQIAEGKDPYRIDSRCRALSKCGTYTTRGGWG